jgi:hypothetical protein
MLHAARLLCLRLGASRSGATLDHRMSGVSTNETKSA